MTNQDIFFLGETLKLAKKGKSWTNPGPLVGCVIVKNEKIIAKGYYRRFGSDHAEMDALKNTRGDVKGATMFVTLEPCHLPYDLAGARVPCTDVIKQAGINAVRFAMFDSNPEVRGRGKQALENMGINTEAGILESEALQLNEVYHHFMTRGRPFVAIQFGASLDGKIATRSGDSKWINNEKARKFCHSLRGSYQAILVGINTVILDNPKLGAGNGLKDPLRIILDPDLRIPLTAQVLRDKNVLIATSIRAQENKLNVLKQKGVKVLVFKEAKIALKDLLNQLKTLKINSVFVEGGGKTLGYFFDEKLADKVYAFHAPLLIGGRDAISAIQGEGSKALVDAIKLRNVRFKRFGDNILTTGYSNFS